MKKQDALLQTAEAALFPELGHAADEENQYAAQREANGPLGGRFREHSAKKQSYWSGEDGTQNSDYRDVFPLNTLGRH